MFSTTLENFEDCLLTVFQVRKYVIRREVQPKGEGKKAYTKAPKIQRLVTPQRLQHKRHRLALKRRNAEAAKDAAVRLRANSKHIPLSITNIFNRTTTLSSSPSVFRRRSPSAPSSRSAVLLPCDLLPRSKLDRGRRLGVSSGGKGRYVGILLHHVISPPWGFHHCKSGLCDIKMATKFHKRGYRAL